MGRGLQPLDAFAEAPPCCWLTAPRPSSTARPPEALLWLGLRHTGHMAALLGQPQVKDRAEKRRPLSQSFRSGTETPAVLLLSATGYT